MTTLLITGPRVFISPSSASHRPKFSFPKQTTAPSVSPPAALTLLLLPIYELTLYIFTTSVFSKFYKLICSTKTLLAHQSSDNPFPRLKCPNPNKNTLRNAQRWCILSMFAFCTICLCLISHLCFAEQLCFGVCPFTCVFSYKILIIPLVPISSSQHSLPIDVTKNLCRNTWAQTHSRPINSDYLIENNWS